MNIESNIPVPPAGKCRSAFTDMVRSMKVNQSILVDSWAKRDHARKVIKALGGQYVSRKMDGGWRVWRTA
jgi:hypothetical protein